MLTPPPSPARDLIGVRGVSRRQTWGGVGRPTLIDRFAAPFRSQSWQEHLPEAPLRRVKTVGPQTHKLPFCVMWGITLLTAVIMALINFCQIYMISYVVEWKFGAVQEAVDAQLSYGIIKLVGICTTLALLCTCLVHFVAPSAGGSGAPENKGWLNGNNIPDLFTWKNLIARAVATMLANTAGYPVGREGPTVTMGSNLAFLVTHYLAEPYVRQWVDVGHAGEEGSISAMIIDEERFAHAKRIVCTVGGACGMAMLFDSPIGGIIYMFEEITSAAWPFEVTFRAFAGTSVCALVSRALLNLCGTNTKAFVVYEWSPLPQPWTWTDVPFFILLAALLGPFSAFHTRACLAVAQKRKELMDICRRCPTCLRMLDAVVYAAVCALTYALVALLADCKDMPDLGENIDFVRYNCKEGQYNPVASLLLTTSEGAVKRLFSLKNANEIHAVNELLAFCAYTTLNISLTGIPVPSGNFTGSMLIGGLAGRLVGALVRDYCGYTSVARTGIYAMVGSAAMLCGFKQMAVAVVVFITGCANDPNLIPPLMLAVTVSLLLNQRFNERGFDEEQILRKKIPFLPPDPPRALEARKLAAAQLCDMLPAIARLSMEVPLATVQKALQQCKDTCDFPVVKSGGICIGFTTRARLEAALSHASRFGNGVPLAADEEDTEELLCKQLSASLGRQSSLDGAPLPVARLAERSPYTILDKMPATRLYALFSKAGVRVASVVDEEGKFCGMISRRGLIERCRTFEESGGELDDEEMSDLPTEGYSDDEHSPMTRTTG